MMFFICFSPGLVRVRVKKIFPSIDDIFHEGMKSFRFGLTVLFQCVPVFSNEVPPSNTVYNVHPTAGPIIIHSQPISGRFLLKVEYLGQYLGNLRV